MSKFNSVLTAIYSIVILIAVTLMIFNIMEMTTKTFYIMVLVALSIILINMVDDKES